MSNVVASFSANITPYQRAMAQMTSATAAMQSKVSSTSQKVGSAMSSIGKGVTIAGAAITAMAVKAVNGYGNFENSINKAAVVGGSSTKALKGNISALEDEALKLGTKLPVSAQDVSDAMLEMARNGASINDLKNEFPKIAEAAAVAGEDMSNVATTVQQAMNIWGGGTKNAAKDSAVLALNANKSSASVSDMGQVFANVGNSAKNLGLSVVDVSTATGIMANSGLQAAQGSQDLNFALSKMVKPTKAQSAEMKKLGITYTNSNGTFKSFRSILEEVASATNGMSDSQKSAALNILFGSAGAKAMIPLLTAVSTKTKDGKTKWDAYSGALSKVGSSASSANKYLSSNAQNMTQNVGQSIDQMKDDWTSLVYSSLKADSGTIQNVAKYFGNLANAIEKSDSPLANFAKTFVALSPAIGVGTIAVGTFLTAVGKIISSFTAIVGAIGSVGRAFGSLATFLVANPWVALAVAIAAVTAALVYFFTQTKTGQQLWSSFTSFLSTAWQGLVSIAQNVWSSITSVFSAAVTTVETAWSAITSFFSTLWNGIVTQLSPIISAIVNLWNAAVALIEAVWQGLVTAASTIFNAITPIVQVVVTAIVAIWQTLTTYWTAVWNVIISITTAIWNTIKAVITAAFNVVKAVITTVLSAIQTIWSTGWNVISTVASTVWSVIKTVISTVINAIASILRAVLAAIQGNWSGVWNNLKAAATTIWNGIKSVLTTIWNGIKSVASSIWNGIKSVISTVWSGIKSVSTSAANGVKSVVTSIFNGLKSVVSSIWSGIRSVTSSAWNGIRSVAVSLARGLVNGVRSAWSGLRGMVSGIWGGVRSAINGALHFSLFGAGHAIMSSFFSGLKSMWGSITHFVGNIASWIRKHKGPISYDKKLLIPAGNAIMTGLNKGLQTAFTNVQSNVSGMAGALANTVSAATAGISTGDLSTSISSGDLVQPITNEERITPTVTVKNELVGDKIYTSVKTNEARKTSLNGLTL